MEFYNLSLNDIVTIIIIIAQGGIMYYRLKKVEQSTDRFNDLFIEFAVHKNAFQNHIHHFEKQSSRAEKIIDKLDKRIANIESHAYEVWIKSVQE